MPGRSPVQHARTLPHAPRARRVHEGSGRSHRRSARRQPHLVPEAPHLRPHETMAWTRGAARDQRGHQPPRRTTRGPGRDHHQRLASRACQHPRRTPGSTRPVRAVPVREREATQVLPPRRPPAHLQPDRALPHHVPTHGGPRNQMRKEMPPMDEDSKYLIDVNKDNLDRVISFVDVMDGKAKFILTLVLALTAYLVTQLGPYLDAHAKWGLGHPWAPVFFVLLDLVALACL